MKRPRRKSSQLDQILKGGQKELERARALLERAHVRQLRGSSVDPRELRRIKAREYRAMLKIERALGTYSPVSVKLTPSRMARVRSAWRQTEKLLSGAAFVEPAPKPRKGRKRNYKSEYLRRINLGLLQGRSRSQARGHPKAKETHAIARRAMELEEHQLQVGLRRLRDGKSLTETARELGISPERFRRQLNASGVAVKRGSTWQVREDAPRQMPLYSNGRQIVITVPDLDTAGMVGSYWNAVKQLLWNNEPDYLEPFAGKSVIDTAGKAHPFETDPNTLYRLSLTGTETFEQVYRIVVT